ncbi:MAG: DUF4274 domain-containing protein [Pseudomonadota bacterium]
MNILQAFLRALASRAGQNQDDPKPRKDTRVDWDAMTENLRDDIFSGKYDGMIKPAQAKPAAPEPAKPEPVRPATKIPEAASNTADRLALKRDHFSDSKVRLPKSQIEHLASLVRHIRPGTLASDVDALAEVSDGWLSVERLSDQYFWGFNQSPCTLAFSKPENGDERHAVNVLFLMDFHDPENITRDKTAQDILESVPGAKLAPATDSHRKSNYERVDIPVDGAPYVARLHFRKGALFQTQYNTAENLERSDAAVMEWHQKQEDEKAAKKAKQDAFAAMPLDEKLAQARSVRAKDEAELGVDGTLRKWASSHSAWGESSNRWESFANWLITNSGPDDWHFLTGMNWDHGMDIFHWIVRQPDTDIATIGKIIWGAGVSSHLQAVVKGTQAYDGAYLLEGLDLIVEAADRVRDAFYSPRADHTPIAFEVPYDLNLDSENPDIKKAYDWLVPDVLRTPIKGRHSQDVRTSMPEFYGNLIN